jgi:hypothetical protein
MIPDSGFIFGRALTAERQSEITKPVTKRGVDYSNPKETA